MRICGRGEVKQGQLEEYCAKGIGHALELYQERFRLKGKICPPKGWLCTGIVSKHLWMGNLGTGFSGKHSGTGLIAGLSDLRGLFQPS